MALSILSVSPAVGETPGQTRITIEGTDFDIHPFPPVVTGYIGDSLGPSVKVTVGGIEAERVWVFPKPGGAPGETTIECSTPRFVGDPATLPTSVDVVVENLINPGSVTSVGAFKYQHPSAVTTSFLFLVVRALVQELRRQIPFNKIALRTHTDYDSDTIDGLNLVDEAEIPILLLRGPTLTKAEGNYFQGEIIDEDADPLEWRKFREMTPYDLSFSLLIVDKSVQRLINYASMLSMFYQENGRLRVEKVTGDPTQGFYEYDLDEGTPIDVNQVGNNDNLSTASGSIIVRGVVIERLTGVEREKAIKLGEEDVNIFFEQFGC